MLGKTNMDEFAMGSSNENSYYGPVRNPWDRNVVPGGSSGGSAAAVAANAGPGRYRHRYRRLHSPARGVLRHHRAEAHLRHGFRAWAWWPFASSLDQGGPMARSAEDCALLLNAMAGHDPLDSTSSEAPTEDYSLRLEQTALKGLRIGLPGSISAKAWTPGYRSGSHIEAALAELEALGAECWWMSRCPTATWHHTHLLHHCARGGFYQPVPLRRGALRSSLRKPAQTCTTSTRAPGRKVLAMR